MKMFWERIQEEILMELFYFFGRTNHSGRTKNRAKTLKYNPINGTRIITKSNHCFCVILDCFFQTNYAFFHFRREVKKCNHVWNAHERKRQVNEPNNYIYRGNS